ncbi:MAG: hypothetical protein K0R27_72 [Xanthobacteraceae bacterium]|jgi:hypothetical protein|nr:hypothetical protein [Xanthobacteraceae bacterium]
MTFSERIDLHIDDMCSVGKARYGLDLLLRESELLAEPFF